MWHSLDNRLDASDTPASCALSDGSSGRLLGTVGIPQRKNHTATGGPEQGQKRDLILQIGTTISSVFKIKHSTRGTNHNLHASKSLYIYADFINSLLLSGLRVLRALRMLSGKNSASCLSF